jgi:hypothetical protein
MGIKSINKYLNQYTAAEPEAQAIAIDLTTTEEKLATDLRKYL